MHKLAEGSVRTAGIGNLAAAAFDRLKTSRWLDLGCLSRRQAGWVRASHGGRDQGQRDFWLFTHDGSFRRLSKPGCGGPFEVGPARTGAQRRALVYQVDLGAPAGPECTLQSQS